MNKKDIILKNALEIFNENGYVGTSINDVAKKSGIAKSTIFHYFENKEDSAVIKNQEQNNKSNKVETPKAINVEPKIFYIRDYNYDLSSCSQAANNYMNQVLSSSNIDLSGYVEPYQENGVIVGYKVLFK